jgi:hypothetical protein
MALFFFTSDPKALLAAFNQRIDQREPLGKITTWVRDAEGDYTHVAKNWAREAWLRPRLVEGALVFNILGNTKHTMTAVVYGYYHGHLTETFLTHFDSLFSTASSTAGLTAEDDFGGADS